MKRLVAFLFLSMLLLGCASANQSEFWTHDSMYKNWDHTKFSWTGYRNPTAQVSKESMAQGWWGIEVPYVPAR
jgi:hypothetical protein